ncbi:MAG: hypothetical protein EBS36_00175 [Actinobacteria bacterium]|nr:hypothetical protein [Actinomycetota bacterium]NBY16002.1 hypothetical protein [Actinomycetota bacterium]
MKLFQRPQPLPKEIRSHFAQGEFLLAWGLHRTGILTVTDQRLLVSIDQELQDWFWSDALSARWEAPDLHVIFLHNGEPKTVSYELTDPGLVPTAVRDRVTSIIVIDRYLDVAEVGKVRFIARRTASGIQWTTLPGGDLVSSGVSQSRIKEALSSLRSTLGI